MQRFLTLDQATQQLAMTQAAAATGLLPVAVEKDFWVCWTLSQLFALPEIGEQLTFKGGTSLSKAWHLIQRFSEDIDLVIDKTWLGIGEGNDPESATTISQRKKRLTDLRHTTRERVAGSLRPALQMAFEAGLPKGLTWSLELDPTVRDQQTLLFTYPRLAAGSSGYLGAQVKIELGARGDITPARTCSVRSLVAEALPTLFADPEVMLRVLEPERTFLEKVALLHEETFRDPAKGQRPTKLARHYYDVAKLIQAGVGQRALADGPLFDRVVAHRRVYFEQPGVDYDLMAQRRLRLVPDDSQMEVWGRDYEAMRGEMFYGTPPAWSEVIQVVRAWEQAFNQA